MFILIFRLSMNAVKEQSFIEEVRVESPCRCDAEVALSDLPACPCLVANNIDLIKVLLLMV